MVIPLTIGYILDLLIGDPHWLPHPIRFIGTLINKLESLLRKKERYLKFKGLILLILTSGISFLTVFIILYLLEKVNIYIADIVCAFIIFQILATKSLFTETNKVYKALLANDLDLAKKQLSYLVSRDCESMNKTDVIRSTIETISENIVDGITSPLFYILIGGAPLGMFYKAVNTLDSMVGYKNDKYMDFGYFSAKFDDFVNYVPARISSIIIIFSSFLLGLDFKLAFKTLIKDRRNHSSPNSGYAEAPVAGALGIQLGGKVSYFGVIHNKPTMGLDVNEPENIDIRKTHKIMFLTSLIFFSLCIGVSLLWKN
ncbi:MAG: adenosylcobinamide-phosphate synthase CbiB [Spirochaetaceae bacterium]